MAELGVDAPPQPPKRVFRESPASSTGAESSILSSPVKSSDNAGGQSFKNNSALLVSFRSRFLILPKIGPTNIEGPLNSTYKFTFVHMSVCPKMRSF